VKGFRANVIQGDQKGLCAPDGYKTESYKQCSKHAVAQWLRHCGRNRKVTGSILDDVIGIFH
jgi:hypothetical protein